MVGRVVLRDRGVVGEGAIWGTVYRDVGGRSLFFGYREFIGALFGGFCYAASTVGLDLYY